MVAEILENATQWWIGRRCEELAEPIEIEAGAVWVCHRPRPGLEIRCEHGSIWITQEGEIRDIILREGDVWSSRQRSKVVVQGLGGAAVFRISRQGRAPAFC